MTDPTLTTSTTTPAIARAAATVLVIAAVMVGLGPASVADAASTEHTYHCTSAVGASDTSYTIDAVAPTQVEQGSTFAVDPVVVTGTPPVDLLLADITFGILAPAGATLTSPAEIHFDGPGSTDPPGPIAPAGVPNSSPPMSFSMVATGAVGSTISIYPAPEGILDEELAPYRSDKSTLKFPLHQPVPYDLIGRVAAHLATRN